MASTINGQRSEHILSWLPGSLGADADRYRASVRLEPNYGATPMSINTTFAETVGVSAAAL